MGQYSSSHCKVVWSDNYVKAKIFLWSLFLGGLNIQDKVQRRFLSLYLNPNWCLCCSHDETAKHLFLRCLLSYIFGIDSKALFTTTLSSPILFEVSSLLS